MTIFGLRSQVQGLNTERGFSDGVWPSFYLSEHLLPGVQQQSPAIAVRTDAMMFTTGEKTCAN